MSNKTQWEREWKRSRAGVKAPCVGKTSSAPSTIDEERLNYEDVLTSVDLWCRILCSTDVKHPDKTILFILTHTQGLTPGFSFRFRGNVSLMWWYWLLKYWVFLFPSAGNGADEVSYCSGWGECGGGLCQWTWAGHHPVRSALPVRGNREEQQGTSRTMVPQEGVRSFKSS